MGGTEERKPWGMSTQTRGGRGRAAGRGAVAVAVGGQPGGVAELDADLVATEAVADGGELLAAGAAGVNHSGYCRRTAPSLPAESREEGVAEAAPDLGLAVGRQWEA